AACIQQAKNGNLNALGPLLESTRSILSTKLRLAVPHHLRNLFRDSDLFQAAMLGVLEKIGSFRGDTEEAFFSWLDAIARHITFDAIRHLLAAKRDCRREESLGKESAALLPDRRYPGP